MNSVTIIQQDHNTWTNMNKRNSSLFLISVFTRSIELFPWETSWLFTHSLSFDRTTASTVPGCKCGPPLSAKLCGAIGEPTGSRAAQKTWCSWTGASGATSATHIPFNTEQQMEGIALSVLNSSTNFILILNSSRNVYKVLDILQLGLCLDPFFPSTLFSTDSPTSQSLRRWWWVTWFSSSCIPPPVRSTQTLQCLSLPAGVCYAQPMKRCTSL